MKQRKVDDAALLEMVKQGKSQKEIAEYFKVSPAAVCLRLKRLLPPPKSLDSLSDKERRFVIEKAKGLPATQAVMNSYEVTSRSSAKAIGAQLMEKPKIREAIDDLMEYHGLTHSYRIQRLRQHVDHSDPGVSLKALDLSWKLDNSYPPTKSIHFNANIDIDPVDLSAYLDRTREESNGD